MKPVDFTVFVDCLQQSLPDLMIDLKEPSPHDLSSLRHFFQKEFDILALLSLYFPATSQERDLCKAAIIQWQIIDHYLAKTPLELTDIQKKVTELQLHLQKLVTRSSRKKKAA
jgi:hypothetical protein